HEARGRPGPPSVERLAAGQTVEGAVVLDRAVTPGVVLQPAALGQAGRIKDTAPVPVLPARGAHVHTHRRLLIPVIAGVNPRRWRRLRCRGRPGHTEPFHPPAGALGTLTISTRMKRLTDQDREEGGSAAQTASPVDGIRAVAASAAAAARPCR